MDPQPHRPRPSRSLGLRAKLALGFASLLAIQLAFGVENASILGRLGGAIDVILRENYRSVVACERMKEALERLDSGALFALAGEPAEGRRLAAENRPRFEAALEIELGNITLPGEGERAERLRTLFAAYTPILEQVQAEELPLAARRALYFRELYPLFRQIKATADEILAMNQGNMVQANDRARALATAASRRVVLLLVLAVALAGLCVALLSRAILKPLAALTRAARAVEGGRLDPALAVTSRDEVGELGAAFNAMTAGLRRREAASRLRASTHWERGGQELRPTAVAAGDLVAQALGEAAPAYDEEGVELTASVAEGTPAVRVDRERVDFVFKALLRNALAHTPERGRIEVRAERDGGRVRFTVTDSGPGVPEGDRERIFEPLYQLPGTEDMGVAGLGLTLARDVVRAHGGEIGCTGAAGGGAALWFTLPVADPPLVTRATTANGHGRKESK